jgi:hypothetical protein
METQIVNPAQNKSSNRERFRTGLILGGILVAIIVSIFLASDAGAVGGAALLPHFTATAQHAAQESVSMGVENFINQFSSLFSF